MLKNLVKLKKKSADLIKQEKDKGGWEGKEEYFKKGKKFESGADRLGGLVSKGKEFLGLIKIPEILDAAQHVTKSEIKICGLNLRNPTKNLGNQSIHIDGFARNNPSDKYAGIVAFIFLDDTKIENGAMRIIPKSHKKLGWPDDHIDIHKKLKNEKRLILKAGSIVVANLNIWHAGSTNYTGELRRVIMLNIKERSYDQLLNYKRYLSSEFKKKLSDEEKYLLAVRSDDPNQILFSGGSANQKRREYFKLKQKKFLSVAKNQ
tara:strand:+ start:1678 stop:2463 length:786 start_codon:yes stop_codon:yes gene_type:complete